LTPANNLKNFPSELDYYFTKMKTLFFPLLIVIAFLLQFPHAIGTPKKINKKTPSEFNFIKPESPETLFKHIEGLDNIFNFFGEEMDKKIEDIIPNSRFLKHNEIFPTFLENHKDSLYVEDSIKKFYQIKNSLKYRYDLNEDAILFGLDDLILKVKEETDTLLMINIS